MKSKKPMKTAKPDIAIKNYNKRGNNLPGKFFEWRKRSYVITQAEEKNNNQCGDNKKMMRFEIRCGPDSKCK